jgi:beta-lactam-binding protein with PASTA domain
MHSDREQSMHASSVVLTALLTAAVTAAGMTFVIERYQLFAERAPERKLAVPLLTGLSEADARANARELQLTLLVEGREPAPGTKAGMVLRQSIAPGQPVPEGASVSIVLAASLPHVPKVTELGVDEARGTLARQGYKSSDGEPLPHPTLAPGRVVQQIPEANTELEAGGVVTLRASSGPAVVETPVLSGLRLGIAREKLAELGLGVKVRWISKAETETDTVLRQKPKPGEALAPSSTVEVVVNR